MLFQRGEVVAVVDMDAFRAFLLRREKLGPGLLPDGLRLRQEFPCLRLTSVISTLAGEALMAREDLRPLRLGFLGQQMVETFTGRAADPAWGLRSLKIPELPEVVEGRNPVYVGLIDSGVDGRHLSTASVTQLSDMRVIYLSNDLAHVDPVKRVYDCTGHGTAVSSVICGRPHNGYSGVEPTAQLKVAMISDSSYHDLHLLAGLDWLCGETVPVVNLSLSCGEEREAHELILSRVRNRALPVVAVGNYAAEWPGSTVAALSVGAVSDDGAIWDGSGRFEEGGATIAPDLLAPGAGVSVATRGSNSAYTLASATSYATPHVAGLCAALIARCKVPPSVKQLEDAVLGSCERSPNESKSLRGIPNAVKALELLDQSCGCF